MQKCNNIKDLLDSDDEFPMDYYEVPATPAYQIDSRFDRIQFKWIKNSRQQTCVIEPQSKTEANIPTLNINQLHNKPILNKGVLNKHDLFCIKSIEGVTGDSTFIWLINFLLHKDIQANYVFLKSCLVSCK